MVYFFSRRPLQVCYLQGSNAGNASAPASTIRWQIMSHGFATPAGHCVFTQISGLEENI